MHLLLLNWLLFQKEKELEEKEKKLNEKTKSKVFIACQKPTCVTGVINNRYFYRRMNLLMQMAGVKKKW